MTHDTRHHRALLSKGKNKHEEGGTQGSDIPKERKKNSPCPTAPVCIWNLSKPCQRRSIRFERLNGMRKRLNGTSIIISITCSQPNVPVSAIQSGVEAQASCSLPSSVHLFQPPKPKICRIVSVHTRTKILIFLKTDDRSTQKQRCGHPNQLVTLSYGSHMKRNGTVVVGKESLAIECCQDDRRVCQTKQGRQNLRTSPDCMAVVSPTIATLLQESYILQARSPSMATSACSTRPDPPVRSSFRCTDVRCEIDP